MIGITGVTGKLGSKVAQLISEQGISARHLARNPQRAALYDNAELVQAAFENSLEAVEALKGIDVLLMVSASESPNRLQQHFAFLDAAHEAGVKHIVYTSFYNAATEATFTLARDHAKTEKYIKERGFTYTFLRDNFYLDFFLDLCLNNGEIRGPAGNGKVSAVARQDVSEVATTILAKPDNLVRQICQWLILFILSVSKRVKSFLILMRALKKLMHLVKLGQHKTGNMMLGLVLIQLLKKESKLGFLQILNVFSDVQQLLWNN